METEGSFQCSQEPPTGPYLHIYSEKTIYSRRIKSHELRLTEICFCVSNKQRFTFDCDEGVKRNYLYVCTTRLK
jgi:hypothetical protein